MRGMYFQPVRVVSCSLFASVVFLRLHCFVMLFFSSAEIGGWRRQAAGGVVATLGTKDNAPNIDVRNGRMRVRARSCSAHLFW